MPCSDSASPAALSCLATPQRAPQRIDHAGNPGRKADDDYRKDPSQDKAPILGKGLQLVLQQRKGEGADDRAEKTGKAAEHSHEDKLAGMRPIDDLRIG